MFAALKEIVPGAASWPRFVRNRGEQFEGRFSLVELARSPSILFDGMDGSMLPIAVAHGEGRAEFANDAEARAFSEAGLVSARYIEGNRQIATDYPANPNGSPFGIAAVTNADGRVTITMPHPERSFRYAQNSWRRMARASTAAGTACSATRGSGWTSGLFPPAARGASSTKNLRTFMACCRRPLRT